MLRPVIAFLALAFLYSPTAIGQVGEPYRAFRSTPFAKFFSVTTRSRTDLPDGGTDIHLEPGGYQQHIDIHVRIDQSMTTQQARLRIARAWLGDQTTLNPMARDIAKSFLADVSCQREDPGLKTVVDQLWHAQGSDDNVLRTADAAQEAGRVQAQPSSDELRVFLGRAEPSTRSLDGCEITLANVTVKESQWLEITIVRKSAR